MSKGHICLIRDEIQAAEQELERDLPADDVLDFDIGVRILLLIEFWDQVIIPLPSLAIEPVNLSDKFLAWMKARLALDEADRELNRESAADELIRSKRQLEKYIGILRNRAHNAVQLAQEVQEDSGLEKIVRDLRADVLKYPASYAKGGGAVPFIVLTVFEFSRYLKATL